MTREPPNRHAATALQTLITLACLLAIVGLWYIFPKEFVFSDPVRYAIKSYELGPNSNWKVSDPRDHRIGLLALHWLGFQVFGTSATAVFLPQLLLLLALAAMVLRQCASTYEQLLTAFTLTLLIPQSVTIFPDLGVATLMFAAALLLRHRHNPWRGAGFAALGFAALLFKLTAYWLIIPFAYFLLRDLVTRRRNTGYYLAACGTGSLLLLSYAGFNEYMFGDPLARLKTINNSVASHLWAAKSATEILGRLSVGALNSFTTTFGPAFLLSLIGAVAVMRSHRHLAVYFWGALVLFTFGSVSLTAYQPLPLIPRMMAPLVPLIALLAAKTAPAIIAELRPRSRPLKRAIMAVVFLSLGMFALGDYYNNYSRAKTSLRHAALSKATAILVADPNAILLVAEPRTKVYFRAYAGFSRAYDSRVFVCPSPAEITATTVYFIDLKRARFMERAYASQVCMSDIRQQADAAGADVIYDDASIFLGIAVNPVGQE